MERRCKASGKRPGRGDHIDDGVKEAANVQAAEGGFIDVKRELRIAVVVTASREVAFSANVSVSAWAAKQPVEALSAV